MVRDRVLFLRLGVMAVRQIVEDSVPHRCAMGHPAEHALPGLSVRPGTNGNGRRGRSPGRRPESWPGRPHSFFIRVDLRDLRAQQGIGSQPLALSRWFLAG